jgi:hypothetical protein
MLLVNYNRLMESPSEQIRKISGFIEMPGLDLSEMAAAVDRGLYRCKKSY